MITDAILSFLYIPVSLIVGSCNFLLPLITLPAELPIGLSTLIGYISWLFPISAILPLLLFKIALGIFNISWKFALRVKSFIPGMGN